MSERSDMIEWLRGEIVGPGRQKSDVQLAHFENNEFRDTEANRRGPLAWIPSGCSESQEILYYAHEPPYRKYGTGLLHPQEILSVEKTTPVQNDSEPLQDNEIQNSEDIYDEYEIISESVTDDIIEIDEGEPDQSDDFDVTSPDVLHPSTIGISFCIQLNDDGKLVIRLPQYRRFVWQEDNDPPFHLNGRYESCKRLWKDVNGSQHESAMWRRCPAVSPDCEIEIAHCDLLDGKTIGKDIEMPRDSPLKLRLEIYPRNRSNDIWLITAVLRNSTESYKNENILYQTYFEVFARNGEILKYPESQRPFEQLDEEEQSLALLYRESASWGIGHGCAAGWDAEPGETPEKVYADILPAVELPSMTPDIKDTEGIPIRLSMRELAELGDGRSGPAWESIERLVSEYGRWITNQRKESSKIDHKLNFIAGRNLDACEKCLKRINKGIELLRNNHKVRQAFRLTNLAMLLQQIATKQIKSRSLCQDKSNGYIHPEGTYESPWDMYEGKKEGNGLGNWRAFQIAFLLISLEGLVDGSSPDREAVDLIWFPTGGGKTEAYMAVMAFYMFHERLLIKDTDQEPRRDGTNVLMRYTLRMLTTQQFQRAASLICSMEFLRRNPDKHRIVEKIPGQRFSLGLWVGRDGSPNDIEDAKAKLDAYQKGKLKGNPFILTECPWCLARIGLFQQYKNVSVHGIQMVSGEGPLLHCTDPCCTFGTARWQDWLPIEIIDERIYDNPPSLVIGTADKLAMISYRPKAGSIFGWEINNHQGRQVACPPGLIVQDELHLISGPLGTVYALYEGIFERLCTYNTEESVLLKPKIIASTATIRGAADQVKALYARTETNLFPSPGLLMGDSFFGKYATDDSGKLRKGRLYLGIHASEYGSILTAQVRTFSAALFRPYDFKQHLRDPWWTLLAFYNSLRELGGGKTLFDSDIKSRLKFMFNREGYGPNDRRNLPNVEELTSRLSQAEIVGMMDRLSLDANNKNVIDACLASNIIEVGVDIDRLSLMGVVGQPKTTATYIQITGRVGRRWSDRPGLILMVYNPSKSRDRSHFEQFHSYHRRLYERVEPTSATPFALSAIKRALPGALIAWARQQCDASVWNVKDYESAVNEAYGLLIERCQLVQSEEDVKRSLAELKRVHDELICKWELNPQEWEKFPQNLDDHYLMLWPGQYRTPLQEHRGVEIPSSMRQVDASAELCIDQGYILQYPQSMNADQKNIYNSKR